MSETLYADLVLRYMGRDVVTVKGDVPGHEFHGNQYSGGQGGGSMGDAIAGDSHAQKNKSVTSGKRKMPGEMSRQEYDALPVVYHGSNAQNESSQGHVYVSNDRSIAASHGRVSEFKVLPGSSIYPDPEIEGEQNRTLNGINSLKHGSAVIHSGDLIPNLHYDSWKHTK